MRKGNIWKVDERICALAKKVLEKIIWKGFENVKRKDRDGKSDKTGAKELQYFGC